MILQVASDMSLFTNMNDRRNAQTLAELAKTCNVDEKLMKRILLFLSASGLVETREDEKYSSTALSDTLKTRDARRAISLQNEVHVPCFSRAPVYYKKHGFRNPTLASECTWQDSMQTDVTLSEWLKQHPEQSENLGGLLKGLGLHVLSPWYDIYPVDQLLNSAKEGAALVVDVGGGTGSDLEGFQKRYPQPPRRLILQDLPDTLENATGLDDKIEIMAHDFFKPQPIKELEHTCCIQCHTIGQLKTTDEYCGT